MPEMQASDRGLGALCREIHWTMIWGQKGRRADPLLFISWRSLESLVNTMSNIDSWGWCSLFDRSGSSITGCQLVCLAVVTRNFLQILCLFGSAADLLLLSWGPSSSWQLTVSESGLIS
jgi:hypothetical protein